MNDQPCSACGGRGYIGGEPGKGSWETLCPICLDEPMLPMTTEEAVKKERREMRDFVLYLAERDSPGPAWECPFLMKWLDERDGTTEGMDALKKLYERHKVL